LGPRIGLLSDDILACFEEALGDRLPEMGTDAAAGREANAELREGVEDVECRLREGVEDVECGAL